jgi:diguanylate cyclase (GGDEF)-like protein/PAS domain S-box-containing protein
MIANLAFAGIRMVDQRLSGNATGYWINVFCAVSLWLLSRLYRRQPQHFVPIVHTGIGICAACLVLPVIYGNVSSPWWLSILPLGATLIIDARAGAMWAATCVALLILAQVLGPSLTLPGTVGEPVAEAVGSRSFLILLLFGIAWQFRVVTTRQAERLLSANDAIAKEGEKSRVLLRNASDGIHIFDANGNVVDASDSFCRMLGYTREEVLHMNVAQWDVGMTDAERAQTLQSLRTSPDPILFESRHRRKDGSVFVVEVSSLPVELGGQRVLFCASRDISARKASEAALRQSEERFREIFRSTLDAINFSRVDDGRYVDVNPAFEKITGYSRDEILGRAGVEIGLWVNASDRERLAEMVRRNGFASNCEFQFRRKNGEILWGLISVTTIELQGQQFYLSITRDITEAKQVEETIHRLAYFDPLTRLPNRQLLMDRLGQALAAVRRARHFGALLMMDLDHFKRLNDTRGHDAGDRLLTAVGATIAGAIRSEDTVSRIGGDEFVVIRSSLDEDPGKAAVLADVFAERIRASIEKLGEKPGEHAPYRTTVSIGVTLFSGAGESREVLLKEADVALYQAKDAGRNVVRFFSPEMQSAIEARAALEEALRVAVAHGQFELHFQPQVDVHGRCLGVEALVRWNHPEKGLVPPANFIPLAEETGLILPIGHWVLTKACEQQRIWSHEPTFCDLRISVNVSPRQFRQPDFVEQVEEILNRSGADPERLSLEMTESAVLHDIESVIEKMRRIESLGVAFALDDFGTGYSSLSYLKRLPLRELKIDRLFLREIDTSPKDAAIVRAILSMSQTLGIRCVAEGVETESQRRFLFDNDCYACQGFLFARPMPVVELQDWLRTCAP